MNGIELTTTERCGRTCVSSTAPWESIVGYSRAVRAGNIIAVTGTVGRNADGGYPESIEAQARRALQIVRASIEALGGKLENVIRTRMFTTDISRWREIAIAHAETFGEIRPATTMVQVMRLIDGEALIEIEADAVVSPLSP